MKTAEQVQAEMDLFIGRRIWLRNVFTSARWSVLVVGAKAFDENDFCGPRFLIEEPQTGDRVWLFYHETRTQFLTPLEELAECAE